MLPGPIVKVMAVFHFLTCCFAPFTKVPVLEHILLFAILFSCINVSYTTTCELQKTMKYSAFSKEGEFILGGS
jgi:hypothetical protein